MAEEGAVTPAILCSGPAVPLRGEERHYFYKRKTTRGEGHPEPARLFRRSNIFYD